MIDLLQSVISLVTGSVDLSLSFILFPAVCILTVVFLRFTFRLIRGDF